MKTRMIKLLVIGSMAFYFTSCMKENKTQFTPSGSTETVQSPTKQVSPTPIVQMLALCCDIARKKFDCLYGGGLCNCKISLGGCGAVDGGDGDAIISSRTRLVYAKVSGNTLTLSAIDNFPTDAGKFVFDEATSIGLEAANQLGFSDVVILPGSYPVQNPDGKPYVTLNVKTSPRLK